MYWNRIRLGYLLKATFQDYIDLFDALGLSLLLPERENRITCKCQGDILLFKFNNRTLYTISIPLLFRI